MRRRSWGSSNSRNYSSGYGSGYGGYGRRNSGYRSRHGSGYSGGYGEQRQGLFSRFRNRQREYGNGYNSGYGSRYSGYGGGYGGYGGQYGSERPRHFWNQNDGYSNYYGSEENGEKSLTAKAVSFITGIVSKTKSPAKKEIAASSSNAQYDSAIKEGDYAILEVKVEGSS